MKIIILHDLQWTAANEHFQAIPFLLVQETNQHSDRSHPISYTVFHWNPIPKTDELYTLAKLHFVFMLILIKI